MPGRDRVRAHGPRLHYQIVGHRGRERHRLGAGFGTFTAIYGLAWMAGGTLIGALYGHSVGSAETFVVITQVVALVAFIPVALGSGGGRGL